MTPQGTVPPGRLTVLCCECRDQGKHRVFHTASGFLTHLRRYHGAKETDGVTRETEKP